MVDRPKPLVEAARALRTRVRPKTIRLNDADYRAIIKHVPLKPGVDMARLKTEIRTAAQWYIIRAELRAQLATPRRVRATFVNLHKKAKAFLDVIKTFPPELRPQVRESIGPDEQDQRNPVRQKAWRRRKIYRKREAWPSPLAIVEAELERLIPIAQKAVQSITVKTGPKEHTFVEPKQMLVRAWKNAAGRSPLTEDQREAFVNAFELALTSRLNKQLKKRNRPSIPVPSQHQVVKAVAKK